MNGNRTAIFNEEVLAFLESVFYISSYYVSIVLLIISLILSFRYSFTFSPTVPLLPLSPGVPLREEEYQRRFKKTQETVEHTPRYRNDRKSIDFGEHDSQCESITAFSCQKTQKKNLVPEFDNCYPIRALATEVEQSVCILTVYHACVWVPGAWGICSIRALLVLSISYRICQTHQVKKLFRYFRFPFLVREDRYPACLFLVRYLD